MHARLTYIPCAGLVAIALAAVVTGLVTLVRPAALAPAVTSIAAPRPVSTPATPSPVATASAANRAPAPPFAGAHPANPAPAQAVAADPPEPTPPEVECRFTPTVSCHDGVATRTALQPPPFEGCALTQPSVDPDFPEPGNRAYFSAVETRDARTRTPQTCCYVDFIMELCL